MGEQPRAKIYDLEERTFVFAKDMRLFVKQVPRTTSNFEDVKQLVRSSGSVGANYLEANESLGDKDLLMRFKISRKEAKESRYWLRLLDLDASPSLEPQRASLISEAEELVRIFSAIVRNRSNSTRGP